MTSPEFSAKIPLPFRNPVFSRKILGFAVVAALLPQTLLAQTLVECDDWRSHAANIAEPWEDNTRTYAEGAVRVTVMDAYEPAAGAFHLLILSPGADEFDFRQCKVMSFDGGTGFAGLNMEGTTAQQDAAAVSLTMPATRWLMETDTFTDAVLTVKIDLAGGEITGRLD